MVLGPLDSLQVFVDLAFVAAGVAVAAEGVEAVVVLVVHCLVLLWEQVGHLEIAFAAVAVGPVELVVAVAAE